MSRSNGARATSISWPCRRRPRAAVRPRRGRSATALMRALSAVTSIEIGSMSVAIAFACGHSASAAKASSPVPVPMSATLAKRLAGTSRSRSSAARQPAVVACWPVPKASPASISKLIACGSGGVGRGVDEEAPGADRLEPGLAHRHPIVLAEVVDFGRRVGGERGQRGEIVARRLDRRNKRGSASRRAAPGRARRRRSPGAARRTGTGPRCRATPRPRRGCSANVTRQLISCFLGEPLVERLGLGGGIGAAGVGVEQRLRADRSARASRWPRDAGSAGSRSGSRRSSRRTSGRRRPARDGR